MSRARRRLTLVLLSALAVPATTPVARAVAEGLETQLPSPVPIAYRGRKVVVNFTRHGPQVSSLSVLCQPGGGERRELHATHGVFVTDGESAWQYLPERGVVLKRPARGEGGEVLRAEQLQRALASYTVRVAAAGQVAGRRSRFLEFLPRQAGSRPRRLVWIDDETGLILRTEVYGTDSSLSWLSVFEELEYLPTLDAANFKMHVPSGVRVEATASLPCLEPAAAAHVAGMPVALPVYLPEGFVRQCVRARRQPGYSEIQVIFGDGLTMLSMFESTRFREAAGHVEGPTVAIGQATGRWHKLGLLNGISWRAPWAYMALLGELSPEELQKVAGSVRVVEHFAAPGGR